MPEDASIIRRFIDTRQDPLNPLLSKLRQGSDVPCFPKARKTSAQAQAAVIRDDLQLVSGRQSKLSSLPSLMALACDI